MKIIIGLGNPGKEYALTRHNAGFMMVDRIKDAFNFPDFSFSKKFNSEISEGSLDSKFPPKADQPLADKIQNSKLLLIKPQTFMNNSGEAVQAVLSFYKLSPEDIIVIHDDLDIALGKYKIATDSSSAGHNGVQDIIDKLGTKKFTRIRIGIGQERDGAPVCRLDAKDFVLQKFSEKELKTIENVSGDVLEEIKKCLSQFRS